MTLTHHEALLQIDSDYRRNHGLKIQNNTRLYMRGTPMSAEFGVVLHGTEVVTITRNNGQDIFTLRSGGYRTPTTLDRIRRWSPAQLFSDKGEWFLWLEPRKSDPRPHRVDRTIPKPYTSEDPGPEPRKTSRGWTARADVARDDMVCIAGNDEQHERLVNERVYKWQSSRPEGIRYDYAYGVDELADTFSASVEDKPMQSAVRIEKFNVYFGLESPHYCDDEWREMTGQHKWQSSKVAEVDGERWEYRQCPHCAAFDVLHQRWEDIMHGAYWSKNRGLGFKKMRQMLDRFGSMEAWQEAYIADFRARREYLRLEREWEARNRIEFYDGIEVNSAGYASRLRKDGPSPAKLRRHRRDVERIKERIEEFIDHYIVKLQAGMPMPGSADCWYCLMFDRGMEKVGTEPSADHLWSHTSTKDRYYVPSMAVNALRVQRPNITDVGICIILDIDFDNHTMGGRGVKSYDDVKRALRGYLRKRMIPEPPTS